MTIEMQYGHKYPFYLTYSLETFFWREHFTNVSLIKKILVRQEFHSGDQVIPNYNFQNSVVSTLGIYNQP